jgi:tetratricopeptide (TPR) repeat protein
LHRVAGARYGGRSMPFRIKTGVRVWVAVWMALGVSLAAGAQSGSEDEFKALLKQGFELHQQARFAEAIPVLERARALEPGDYFANLLLGIDLLRTGKAKEALPRLELAARTRPGEEIPEDYLGEAEASLGRNAQAAEAYQAAVQRGHGSEQALEAWAGFALERFREIGESLRGSAAGIPTVRRLVAAAAKPASELVCVGSIPALERRLAQETAGRGMEVAYDLSICYAVEAGKAAGQLQGSVEDAAALHMLRGDVLLRLKADPAAAEAEYRQAIELRPGDPALQERLAEAQLTAGDMEAARQSALAALAIDPHRRDALRTLASLEMSNRDYEKALPWLRELAVEAPGDRTVQVQLGKALAQTGEPAEALKHLEPALAAGYPDEKGALHALEARELRALGRKDEAARAEAEARRLSDAFQARSKDGASEGAGPDQ